ncbi:MAG TPA: cupin domain-containing protein [Gemmataceae bacterium]|nr:cupin domain-containing protein [Gemmataceae bacterium]
MKTQLVVLGFLTFFVGSMVGGQEKAGRADEAKHVAVRPDAIKWGPAPPGLPPGAQAAVLVGDPTKSGVPYVIRAKLPDGYRVPPHWHPADENITVLQGTLLVGEGEKLDPSKTEELPAGSFARMPKTMRHFAIAKGETIIQLHGTEPFEINYVNPADDPRKKENKK